MLPGKKSYPRLYWTEVSARHLRGGKVSVIKLDRVDYPTALQQKDTVKSSHACLCALQHLCARNMKRWDNLGNSNFFNNSGAVS